MKYTKTRYISQIADLPGFRVRVFDLEARQVICHCHHDWQVELVKDALNEKATRDEKTS